MKIGRKARESVNGETMDNGGMLGGINVTAVNEKKKSAKIGMIIGATVLMIIWVLVLSHRADSTVSVVMLKENVYKNQVITEDVIMKYDIIRAEFNKYAVVNDDGTKKRRLILWDERGVILNSFAAYPLKKKRI